MAEGEQDEDKEEIDLLAEILEETQADAQKEAAQTERDTRFDALSDEMFGKEEKN